MNSNLKPKFEKGRKEERKEKKKNTPYNKYIYIYTNNYIYLCWHLYF
jgi:hypothetical protein